MIVHHRAVRYMGFADVVVVGAGGCGLAAALEAAQRGAHVVLLEGDAAAGGSTAASSGLVVAAGSDLQRRSGMRAPPEDLLEDLRAAGSVVDGVTRALIETSGALVDWFVQSGCPLEPVLDYRYPEHSRPWLVAPPARRGTEVVAALLEAIRRAGVDLRLRTLAEGLLVDDEGGLCGVAVASPEGPAGLRAGAAVLATGGFASNAAMVGAWIPGAAGAVPVAAPGCRGDGIRWAQAMGAQVAAMDAVQFHPSIIVPERVFLSAALVNAGAVHLNEAGKRFGDETKGYGAHALAMLAQRAVYEVFDDAVLAEAGRHVPRVADARGLLHRCRTAEDLARCIGAPPDVVTDTLEAFNAAAAGAPDPFGRRRFGAPLRPPLWAVRVAPGLVQTLGGLVVDAQARVLRTDGKPIPRLFAGGETVAGPARRTDAYVAGTGLLAAFGLGRLAGRGAAGAADRLKAQAE
ncbi:MAG: FAD-dependent oxidoreductase [Armatimonadota bacterium]|nr:FAD-dependent oxidoreductase [Armatimonadota bacterium]